jgi:hypothetical protein
LSFNTRASPYTAFKRFESRESHIEELAKWAWQEHLRVKVHPEMHEEDHPAYISLLH